MGKVVTTNEETGETTEVKTSVKQNLETLYEIITGGAAVTEPELAVPLIAFREIYDTADHLVTSCVILTLKHIHIVYWN